jgi:transposase-like protein
MPHTTLSEKVSVAAAICPACGSANVQTTSKTVDASTYWRCRQCGEVWNILRRETASRFRHSR